MLFASARLRALLWLRGQSGSGPAIGFPGRCWPSRNQGIARLSHWIYVSRGRIRAPRRALTPESEVGMRKRGALSLVAAGGLLLGGLTLAIPGANAESFGYGKLSAVQKRHVSGALAEALGPQRANRNAVAAAKPAAAP